MTLDKKTRDAWDELKAAARQQQGRSAFREVTVEERAKIAKAWLKAAEPPPYVAKIVEDLLVSKPLTRPVGRIRCKGALLTWMLPKGKVDISKVVAQEPTALSEVLDGLRADSNVQEAWKDIQLHAQTCKQVSGAVDVAVSFEVCPLTWKNEKEVQLHFHTFLKSEVSDLLLKCLHPYCFQDTKPHLSTTIHGIHARPSGGRGCWSGFFYCCIPEKTGTLWCQATKAPFSGFLVNPNWILNLVQSDKLDTTSARKLIVRCANGSRHYRELETHEVHLEQEAIMKAEQEAQRLLGNTLRPSKQYAEVDTWLQQYATARHRYKFLVLQGPSQLGKTAFARSLCDPGLETLEVNCASGDEPDLRAYRLRKHGLVLFDEIVPQQVVSQRKVFQCQSAKVQMGCSATNMYSYEIYVWRKKFVLASNNWEVGMTQLPAADQDWIRANSILLTVTEPMWKE